MKSELLRLKRAFQYAGAGILFLFRNEPNVRIHLALTIIALLLAWWTGFSSIEWAILTIVIGMVFLAEGVNTAIEALVDLASPEYHPQAKIVKDVAAGAVTIAALTAVIVAIFLFIPKLLTMLH